MKKTILVVLMLLGMASVTVLLVACGSGTGTDVASVNDAVSSSNSNSSCNSKYPDLITTTTRSQATADGAQCGSQVANADYLLAAARATCANGDTTSADANYVNYKKVATYATGVVAQLCGGAPGATLPPGTAGGSGTPVTVGLYILYGVPQANSARTVIGGSCATSQPQVPYGAGGGNYSSVYYQLIKSGLTNAQCTSLAASYGLQ